MTDQQRADSVLSERCHTPNLDRFRGDGVMFSNAFCPSPHCCPSRATFFSGLYPSEHGVWHNVNVSNAISRGLNEGVRLWSEDLAAAGYEMNFSGKWHVSAVERPADYGWKGDDAYLKPYLETPEAGWRNYAKMPETNLHPTDRQKGEILRPGWSPYTHYGENENPFKDQDVVNRALAAIRDRAGSQTPWCQFVGTLGPHDPYQVPQRFLDMYRLEDIQLPENFWDGMGDKPEFYRRTRDVFSQLSEEEHREAIRHYLAFCSYEDYLFGQVIDALREHEQLENTIVVYLSDHGDYMGEHGLWCKGLPCFQGAYRIPMVVGWQGGPIKPGLVIDEFMSLADFAPTILEAVGISIDRRMYGKSFLPLLDGESVPDWRKTVYTQSNGNELYGVQRSVMTENWKYVYNGFAYDELYDLKNDPLEIRNLIKTPGRRDTVKRLCAEMWRLSRDNNDACVNPYIMVGFTPFGPQHAFAAKKEF